MIITRCLRFVVPVGDNRAPWKTKQPLASTAGRQHHGEANPVGHARRTGDSFTVDDESLRRHHPEHTKGNTPFPRGNILFPRRRNIPGGKSQISKGKIPLRNGSPTPAEKHRGKNRLRFPLSTDMMVQRYEAYTRRVNGTLQPTGHGDGDRSRTETSDGSTISARSQRQPQDEGGMCADKHQGRGHGPRFADVNYSRRSYLRKSTDKKQKPS